MPAPFSSPFSHWPAAAVRFLGEAEASFIGWLPKVRQNKRSDCGSRLRSLLSLSARLAPTGCTSSRFRWPRSWSCFCHGRPWGPASVLSRLHAHTHAPEPYGSRWKDSSDRAAGLAEDCTRLCEKKLLEFRKGGHLVGLPQAGEVVRNQLVYASLVELARTLVTAT